MKQRKFVCPMPFYDWVLKVLYFVCFALHRYDVSIKPSNGLFMSVPDDVMQKLQAHLSPLNAWSLTGQSYSHY